MEDNITDFEILHYKILYEIPNISNADVYINDIDINCSPIYKQVLYNPTLYSVRAKVNGNVEYYFVVTFGLQNEPTKIYVHNDNNCEEDEETLAYSSFIKYDGCDIIDIYNNELSCDYYYFNFNYQMALKAYTDTNIHITIKKAIQLREYLIKNMHLLDIDADNEPYILK